MGSRLFLICVLSIVLVSAEVIEEINGNVRVASEEPVRARGLRDVAYTGPAVVSNPTRVSFPNYGDSSIGSNQPPYIGFKIPPGTTLTQTRYANESFVYWDMESNTIKNNVAYGCGVLVHSTVNSFCSIDLPEYDSASDTNVYPLLNEIQPVPHLAVTFSCPADGQSRAFLTLWISEESFLDGGLLVATYQYFYGSPGLSRRTGRYRAPACLPVVNKISPGFAFVQGSVIFLEGQNFGVNPDLVTVSIGDSIQCTGVEMVVPNTVMRCIAAGSGSNLIVNVTVESSATVAPFQLISFNANCPLICTAGAYPDPTCASCIRPQSSTDDVGTSRLSQVVSSVSSDLVEATYFSDMTFYATAVRYQQNSVMQVLSIPRYTVPDVTVDMKFAIVATSPLKITALTGLLQGYDTDVIPTLELHYESQQAQWTKVDNNGTTSYRLDLI